MDSYRPPESRRSQTDTYRPSRQYGPPPPWPPRDYNNDGMYHFQGSRGRSRSPPREFAHRPRPDYQSTRRPPPGPRQDYRRRPPPPLIKTAANRPLFNFRHDEAADPSAATPGSDAKFKFRSLDELTDSEEGEMAQSEDEEGELHVNKRLRLNRNDSGVEPGCTKWSNPDPYTSLPPAGDVAAKRTDVVKLIRKARIDTDASLERIKQPDDFISFHDADDQDSDQLPAVSHVPFRSSFPAPAPGPPRAPAPAPTSMVTGKRKRGPDIGDEGRRLQSDTQGYADELVKDEWKGPYGINRTPWLRSHPTSNVAGVALHKEIIDFYEWVKPKNYEEEVRNSIFQRLNHVLKSFTPGELKAFGSYAAALYLPTADMDLVYLTRNFRPGTFAKAQAKNLVYSVAAFLGRSRIAEGQIVKIPHAKVPIIKFIDRVSGLKIDLSFDNDTGLVAIDTFHKWKAEYPIMPMLVSVIKQYLMIRGLNDVSTGGLGGFSAICLVTSLLQHLPITQRPVNLGDILLEFFNFYGNVFDRRLTILRLDPPTYLDKSTHPDCFKDKNNQRLTIIDPHRSDNNISGGTSQISPILDCFSKAHQALTTRLAAYENGIGKEQPSSFLGCLIGGDFKSYETQRGRLRELSLNATSGFTSINGQGRHIEPVQRVEVDRRADRNDPSAADGITVEIPMPAKPPKKVTRGMQRAEQLKTLRPDLAASIRRSISHTDALKLGGYKNRQEMLEDFSVREAAAAKLAGTRSVKLR